MHGSGHAICLRSECMGVATVEPLNEGHFGASYSVLVEKLSSSHRLNMNYWYRKGAYKECPLLGSCPFSEGPYRRFYLLL